MKIIYFMERRFCYCHDKDDFSYDTFLERGIEVEVWSSVYWQVDQNVEKPQGIDTSPYIHYIGSLDDLTANLERVKNDNCFFLMYSYHGYNWIGFIIRKKIKSFNFSFANITEDPSISPEVYTGITAKKAIKNELLNVVRLVYLFMKSIIGRGQIKDFLNCFARLIGPLSCSAKYNFYTGKISMQYIPNKLEIIVRNNNYLLNANSYDEYRFSESNVSMDDPSIPSDYIVFIDQGLGRKNMAFNKACTDGDWNVKRYLNRMNKLFTQLEKDYHCPVVIAAHPKSDYSGAEFDGRKVVQHNTSKMVKEAKLVILHYSTCIGLVTLYKKDVLAVWLDEMNNNDVLRGCYEGIKKVLGYKILNISLDDNIKEYKKSITKYGVNQEKYLEHYIYSKFRERQIETKYDIVARIVCDNGGDEYKI